MDEKKSLKKEKPPLNNYIKYSGLGFQMVGIIGVFTFAGYKIDESRQSKIPLFTAFLSLLGVIIALYIVFRGLKNTN
ncbi:MAG: AtpZ/AtpI family protein [Bacteroidetes bacterium]|nr:AtpZ/AtpI family protein [Bacteroidota bacterium]MBU1372386.1 AtpZ/AtpI family protein [Bacteroidota bacterium]MBU1483410.1 AtpZ/AtpI family protein [Bacteroidota bacterium]MBU1760209.1 AtpZ/AtpI family protein [Bacteroidota bacterium]MBU2267345.1 AtpZ/AtpI family protein [Bacteroidota bacterium]